MTPRAGTPHEGRTDRHGVRAARVVLGMLWVLAVLVACAVPVWFWAGGLIEIEALYFVRQYLDDRTVLQKVFDPHANDLRTYQARELSYFFDYLDAQVFRQWLAAGRLVFVPASALIAGLATIATFIVATRRYPLRAQVAGGLLLLLYLTNYIYVVTGGMLYRSTKPLLAPVLMATTFAVLALLQNVRPAAAARGVPAAIAAALCVMSLLDRQGFFYAVLAFVLLAFHALVAGGRRDVAIAAGGAVGAMVFYNLVAGPAIIERVNGYRPDFAYQQLDAAMLATDPTPWARALELLGQATHVLAGGAPSWLLAALLLAALVMWRFTKQEVAATAAGSADGIANRRDRHRRWTMFTAGIAGAGFVFANVAMFAAMVVRHPPIYTSADHRLWYYPLPFQAMLVAIVAVALKGVSNAGRAPAAIAMFALCVGIVSNVSHWDDYRRAHTLSRWFQTVHFQTGVLKESLRSGKPVGLLTRDYLGFYEFCAKLAQSTR